VKKIVFFVFVIFILDNHVFGQDAERKFTLQTSPLLWFSDVYADNEDDNIFAMDVEGQYRINDRINVSLTVSFLIDNRTVEEYAEEADVFYHYDENKYQINFKPMIIYRPFYTGIRGFYLGFYPNVGLLHVISDDEEKFFTELGFGINIGYKWVFRGGFTMQVGGGIGKTFSIPEESYKYVTMYSDGRIPVAHTDFHLLDFKIGYTF